MQPKYEFVAKTLEKEIIERKYNSDKKLPTEEELMKTFQVSKNTIRKAIDVLVTNGYVYRVQGSGVFLREFFNNGYVNVMNMTGLTKNFSSEKVTSQVIELSIIEPNEELIEKFNCLPTTKIYYVKRIRYLDGEPIEIEESYYNKDIVVYLNKEICLGSIFKYITEDLKLNIGFANRVISCEKLTEEDATLLNLNKDDPSLKLENIVYLSNGKAFDYSIEKYNYSKIKLYNIN
ncbi:MAG: GntR family transcriptional regulator [Clostridium butyricum]|nr:GntR family transcriptional regulator [Clostridium butyricum]